MKAGEPFPAQINRVARTWPLDTHCRRRLQFAHSKLLVALTTLRDVPISQNMMVLNAAWIHAWRALEECGEYRPGPSGTPSEAEKEKKVA